MTDTEREYADALAAYRAAVERLRRAKAARVQKADVRGEREKQRRLRDIEIFKRSKEGVTHRELAHEFGLSRDWIKSILYMERSRACRPISL